MIQCFERACMSLSKVEKRKEIRNVDALRWPSMRLVKVER